MSKLQNKRMKPPFDSEQFAHICTHEIILGRLDGVLLCGMGNLKRTKYILRRPK